MLQVSILRLELSLLNDALVEGLKASSSRGTLGARPFTVQYLIFMN